MDNQQNMYGKIDTDRFVREFMGNMEKDPDLVKSLIDVGKFFATKHHVMDMRSDPEKKNHRCQDCYDSADQQEEEEVLSALGPLLADAYKSSTFKEEYNRKARILGVGEY